MKQLSTIFATGLAALTFTVGLAAARQPPKGTVYRWQEMHVTYDLDNGNQEVGSWQDAIFNHVQNCWADVATRVDTSVPPPCTLDGLNDPNVCSNTGLQTSWTCRQAVFGTAK